MKKNTVFNATVINFASIAILLIIFVYLLIVGRSVLQPLVTAVILWYIMVRLTAFIQHPIKRFPPLPYWIAFLLSLMLTFGMIYWFFLSLGYSINNIVTEASAYQKVLTDGINHINRIMGYKFNTQTMLQYVNFPKVFSSVAVLLSVLAANLSLIIIYLLFIFLEYHTFDKKLKAMCSNRNQYENIVGVFARLNHDISKYLKVKTVVSALTGFASYIILLGFGVQNAEFWALFIFILNYIPTIGAVVAVIITLIAAAVQADSLMAFIALSVILISVQLIIGNFIEPRSMGSYLNLSPMVILLSLAFWGKIWGVLGMLLCVPLMAVLTIILANFKKTLPIAILLTANGEVLKPEERKLIK